MAGISWYWHRLRAMSAGEMLLRARKKLCQHADSREGGAWREFDPGASSASPLLPESATASPRLRTALEKEAERILSGRWRFFGHLELKVEMPPRWHRDYLAKVDLETAISGFKLNHRDLPQGADIKLIWELSRWHEITRLTQAAFVAGRKDWAEAALGLLEDWVKHNAPFQGWNWTSALESGMRLVQFTWIDAMIGKIAGDSGGAKLRQLRSEILPAHVWYTWRHRSFGSSANNHLIGELSGLICAVARWPDLAQLCCPLAELQKLLEAEILLQFAEDGGNREQALNYQLFSFEFCHLARLALGRAGLAFSPAVIERLAKAARFFVQIQVPGDPWDYGDSDNGFVLPVFLESHACAAEWHAWMRGATGGETVAFWLGPSPVKIDIEPAPIVFRESGQTKIQSGGWTLRLDHSPLGYLKTAAHGHLDALHLTLWRNETALVVDPGTGAYYGDLKLREHLASRAAHNGPTLDDGAWPRRLGPFLWEQHHDVPRLLRAAEDGIEAEWATPGGVAGRRIEFQHGGDVCRVADSALLAGKPIPFSVRWQFAPGCKLKSVSARLWQLEKNGESIWIEAGPEWDSVEVGTDREPVNKGFEGICSRHFRELEFGPWLRLTSKGHKACQFGTAFLASAPQ